MTLRWIVLGCLLSTAGCDTITEKGCPGLDMKGGSGGDGGSVLDMTPPPPKCAAAKGLPGDNLICADFTSPQTIVDLTAAGWNFASTMSGTCAGWTVANSKLQVTSFGTLASGSCGFTLPALSASDYQKYSSFTLSVVQRVHIDENAGQTAQVMLGADAPSTRLVTQWTGKGARQTSTMAMAKTDLPNGGTNTYQPWFKISSTTTAAGSFQGWLIESIAVNGIP